MQFRLNLALLVGLAISSTAQEINVGVPIGPVAPMPAPNYATKGLVLPSRPPQVGPTAATYSITFIDPGGANSAFYSSITSAIQAAGAEWNRYLTGSASLQIEVLFSNNPTVNGASLTSGFVRNDGTRDIFEQGAAFELRTGMDPNAGTSDIRFTVGTNYMINTLWFDPNPQTRTDPIPANRVDAISVFTHEFGHAFVFNGFRNGTTGVPPPTFMSTFDVPVTFNGSDLFFNGTNASARYGGPVPLTFNNYGHLGNNSPRPGSDLIPDMMNGVVYNFQTRYFISPIDLEIAKDSGLGVTTPVATASNLVNISTRLNVQPGDNRLIGGFIVTGTAPKKVIVRALGPSLNVNNVPIPGRLGDTTLQLVGPGGVIATNDNWRSTQQAEIIASTVQPPNDLESAIVTTLPASTTGIGYTVIVEGVGNTSGVGSVEVYDLDQAADSQLANISTRGLVQTGDNVMIGGFIISGTGSRRVIVRAIGPSLNVGGMPVPGRLADTTLEIANANGMILFANNDWRTGGQQAEIIATNVPPPDDRESAIVATLPAAAYTAIVRGFNSMTGVALVEAFRLP